MSNIFNRKALFSTAIVTATIASAAAAALAIADGPLLLAPFAAAALGFPYHMGLCRGLALGHTSEPESNTVPDNAPTPKGM